MKFNIEKECKMIQEGWFDDKIKAILKKIENDNLKYTSPTEGNVFKAFTLFKPQDTKILILGQDPYPDCKKAHGYAFSVLQEYTNEHGIDDSLLNIFKAIKAYKNNKNFDDLKEKDIDEIKQWKTNLEDWAKKNKVLLLNIALTYQKINDEEKNKQKEIQMAHLKAWKTFIDIIIKKILESENKLVIFAWGNKARDCIFRNTNKIKNKEVIKKTKAPMPIIIGENIKILYCYHPSKQSKRNKKLNKNFLFEKEAPQQFKQCNDFLKKHYSEEIKWQDI